jgi:hypothetical protein
VLGLRAALGAPYDLFMVKQLCLILFPNPDVLGFRHLSFYLQAYQRAHRNGHSRRNK